MISLYCILLFVIVHTGLTTPDSKMYFLFLLFQLPVEGEEGVRKKGIIIFLWAEGSVF